MKCQNVLKCPVRKKRRIPGDWGGQEGLWRRQNLQSAYRLSVTSLQRIPCPPLGQVFPLPTQSLSSEDFQSSLSICLVITHKKNRSCVYSTNTRHKEYDQHGPGPWSFWSNKCIAVMRSLALVPLLHETVSYAVSPAWRTEQSVHEGWLHEWCASIGLEAGRSEVNTVVQPRGLGREGTVQ